MSSVRVPEGVFTLPLDVYELAVLLELYARSAGRRELTVPLGELAAARRVSAAVVRRSIKKLEELGAIRTAEAPRPDGGGAPKVFTLLAVKGEVPEAAPAAGQVDPDLLRTSRELGKNRVWNLVREGQLEEKRGVELLADLDRCRTYEELHAVLGLALRAAGVEA